MPAARMPRPAVWGVALGTAAFTLIGSFGAAANQPDRRGMDALSVLLVLAGPAALAVRDRWPLLPVAVSIVGADLYVALGYAYGPIVLSVVIALVTAVLSGRRHGAWLLAGAGYLGFAVAGLLDPRASAGEPWGKYVLVAGWLAVVLAVSEAIRARRDTIVQRQRAEAAAIQRREGEQRLQLAQELHDVLAHHISLINVQAGVALHLIDSRPERVVPALADIKVASREALRELRGALDVLRRGEAAPRAPAPQLADLERLVSAVAASGLDVRLDCSVGTPTAIPAAVQLAAYRIVQEALTNVSRHAEATTATVRVHDEPSIVDPERRRERDSGAQLRVEVLDDGVGGTPSAGNGITGMRERAAALGGDLTAGGREGGGFAVVARLPLVAP